MTKSTITREQLLEIIETDHVQCGEASYLARMALAAMDGEPVAFTEKHEISNMHATGLYLRAWPADRARNAVEGYTIPLYLQAQPAPVVPEDIPDSVYEILCQACGGNAWMYSDALWNACRAAMLEQQLVDRVDEKSLISINPAPDLVSLQKKAESIIGNYPGIPDCWCRTCRPVVLNDMRFVVCPDCGNKRCPRANDHRNACTGSNEHGQEGSAYPDTTQSPGSEPATVPGSWIPVSEQMPIEFEAVIAFDGDQVYGEAMYSSDDGFTIDGYEPCDRLNLQNVTYWMPLPAAPQEVKGE
ncbi:TPA: DUF551 domain-containing protein [Klebsiella pneumoniae]